MATKKRMPKWLKKLTAAQRKHLAATCDPVTLRAFLHNRKHQKESGIECLDCKFIEKALNGETD